VFVWRWFRNAEKQIRLYSFVYCVHIVLQTHVLLLRWDVSKLRDRFGNIGYLRINSVITEINFRCNYMQVFFIFLQYK